MLVVAVVGGVPAGHGAEADPGTSLARDDGPNGSHAVLAMSTILLLESFEQLH